LILLQYCRPGTHRPAEGLQHPLWAESLGKRTRSVRVRSKQYSIIFSCIYSFVSPFSENRGAKFRKTSLGCVNEPFGHGCPCGKRVRWSSGWRRLTDLARARLCQAPTDRVNSIFLWRSPKGMLFDVSILLSPEFYFALAEDVLLVSYFKP